MFQTVSQTAKAFFQLLSDPLICG